MAKRNETPEERARWQATLADAAEAKRRLLESVARVEAKLQGEQERRERRRRLIRRLTFRLFA